MDKNTHVYALYSTKDIDHIRYIGVSSDVGRRFSDHLNDAKNHTGRGSYKCSWINKEQNEGHQIQIRILETHPTRQKAYDAEIWWISHLKSTTTGLTNLTRGGDGPTVNPWDIPIVRGRMTAQAEERASREIELRTAFFRDYWSREDNRQAQSERTKMYFEANPEAKCLLAEKSKLQWENKSSEEREEFSRRSSDQQNDPEFQKRMKNLYWENPEFLQKRSETAKSRVTSETRERSRQQMKDFWADPVNKASRSNALKNSDKMKEAAKENKERWKNPDYKAWRSIKTSLGRRYKKAERNDWVLEVI